MNPIKEADIRFGFDPGNVQLLSGMSYGEFVRNLAKDMGSTKSDLMHSAIGVAGEAGELLDAVKKHWVYDKPLDKDNVIEELGDMIFYMQMMMMMLRLTPEQILEANWQKLAKRYHTGTYSNEQAQQRADKQEGETK